MVTAAAPSMAILATGSPQRVTVPGSLSSPGRSDVAAPPPRMSASASAPNAPPTAAIAQRGVDATADDAFGADSRGAFIRWWCPVPGRRRCYGERDVEARVLR